MYEHLWISQEAAVLRTAPFFQDDIKGNIHFRKFSTERKIFRGPHAQYNFFFRSVEHFLKCTCTFTFPEQLKNCQKGESSSEQVRFSQEAKHAIFSGHLKLTGRWYNFRTGEFSPVRWNNIRKGDLPGRWNNIRTGDLFPGRWNYIRTDDYFPGR